MCQTRSDNQVTTSSHWGGVHNRSGTVCSGEHWSCAFIGRTLYRNHRTVDFWWGSEATTERDTTLYCGIGTSLTQASAIGSGSPPNAFSTRSRRSLVRKPSFVPASPLASPCPGAWFHLGRREPRLAATRTRQVRNDTGGSTPTWKVLSVLLFRFFRKPSSGETLQGRFAEKRK